MIKYFQKAFKITNENIILTTPLVLFLFLFSIYLDVSKNIPNTLPSSILLLVTVLFMVSAFFAGWFYMVQKAVELDKQENIEEEIKSKASFDLIKQVPIGIGEYFFSFIGALLIYSIMILIILIAAYHIGLHFIGSVGITLAQLKAALVSSANMKSLVSSMTSEQLLRLNSWNILFFITTAIFSFITLFWPVQIITKTKNPLLAFIQSVCVVFKNFISSIVIFIYISLINFTISLINAFSMGNPILYFFSMLLYFYFLVYMVVLVFLYYDREIKAKDNSDSGTDSIGED